jgi:hypothetical protein
MPRATVRARFAQGESVGLRKNLELACVPDAGNTIRQAQGMLTSLQHIRAAEKEERLRRTLQPAEVSRKRERQVEACSKS